MRTTLIIESSPWQATLANKSHWWRRRPQVPPGPACYWRLFPVSERRGNRARALYFLFFALFFLFFVFFPQCAEKAVVPHASSRGQGRR
jgi:hypothetical protein